jgi:hypothetical protein
MTEKKILTDEEVGTSTVHVGTDPITGLEVYRRFKSLYSDTHEKFHRITYEEWKVAKDGKVYQELFTEKTYMVVNIADTEPPQMKYDQWFKALAPTLLPEINNTLINKIPFNQNNFVI